MDLVEQGIASARAGRARELTDADWENLRKQARRASLTPSPQREQGSVVVDPC
jgi:hypothetical protein